MAKTPSRTSKKTMFAAFTGTFPVALCCFTPILVIFLGAMGMSAFTPYLDWVLLPALAMMIGLTSVTATSDTFPSVLMGIPGTASSQATVLDGFPLSKQGQAARALGAAFTASLIGGVFGAFVLTGAIFVAKPIILSIGFGEQLMLVLLALTMVGMLTGESPAKGLASCGLGLLIGDCFHVNIMKPLEGHLENPMVEMRLRRTF